MTEIRKISVDQWEAYCAQHAHRAVFDEHLPTGLERIDYALLAVDEKTNAPMGYMTVREFDAESVYLKRGGAFVALAPGARLACYKKSLLWLDQRYQRMTQYVENSNIRYLKLSLHEGFRIIGIRNFEGSILLELLRKKGD